MKLADFKGTFITICEGVFIVYIVSFTIKELVRIKRLKLDYLKEYWSWGEWSVILAAFVSMGLYVHRMLLIRDILNIFRKTRGNGYVKLQYVGKIDEFYSYLISKTEL